ncbi:MAG: FAD-dependent oxidoreductase [Planctomycetaceae bacterium]|jgi:NADPH-dependent glutamate synthase beta subunit-like oxidoreductase/ferredoxin|nr:FAD-dependent oxidoreductase [Planctomycetaceae bacterium]
MPTLSIDQKTVTVAENATILEAARESGILIPTLCHWKGCKEATSCLVCLVKVDGRMLPACATKVTEGMQVTSESDEVRNLRRTVLELLLSDHVGDCHAPCQAGCPVGMDIPAMLRHIQQGNITAAIRIVKQRMALPAILGRVCPRPCEKVCRRKLRDAPVAVCQLKRYAAETDLGDKEPYRPEWLSRSGKTVTIIGAGASGLSAAYHLTAAGHSVVLYEKEPQAGGRLRQFSDEQLPGEVLEAEVTHILSLPMEFHFSEEIPLTAGSFQELSHRFDAVILASGAIPESAAEACGLEIAPNGFLKVNTGTYETSLDRIFAIGGLLRADTTVVRSVADGRKVTDVVDLFLREQDIRPAEPLWTTRVQKPDADDIQQLRPDADADGPLLEPDAEKGNEYSQSEAVEQAARCLQCDCHAREKCRLLRYAREYGVVSTRYQEPVKRHIRIQRHGKIVVEPEKCIKCGLCVTIACENTAEFGLTFAGRGYGVHVIPPFEVDWETAMDSTSEKCVEACPTAALHFAKDSYNGRHKI